MKKNDKKMTLILIIFIIIVIVALFLYYLLLDNNRKTLQVSEDVNIELGDTNINLELFEREDFVQLERNPLIKEGKYSNDNMASTTKDTSSDKVFNATKRNPFKPFKK